MNKTELNNLDKQCAGSKKVGNTSYRCELKPYHGGWCKFKEVK